MLLRASSSAVVRRMNSSDILSQHGFTMSGALLVPGIIDCITVQYPTHLSFSSSGLGEPRKASVVHHQGYRVRLKQHGSWISNIWVANQLEREQGCRSGSLSGSRQSFRECNGSCAANIGSLRFHNARNILSAATGSYADFVGTSTERRSNDSTISSLSDRHRIDAHE